MADTAPKPCRTDLPGRTTVTRRALGTLAIGGLAAGAATAGVAGQGAPAVHARPDRHRWIMVTAWPKNAPGPGTSARRIAETLTALSGGRLTITVYGAGEVVPAFEVLDAVAGGRADLGHAASFFWAGRIPAAPVFTAAPFGLTPLAHAAWIRGGEGQALWDALYAEHGVKPFLAGNSGMQMGGWYARRIETVDDLAGLRIRMPGWGGEVLRRLGATPVSLPPGDIVAALRSGVIDAAEFLGPWSDTALGLPTAAPYYAWPGWHEPNGSAELIVNRETWEGLPDDLRRLVEVVTAAEADRGLADATWQNARALQRLRDRDDVTVMRFPDTVLAAARRMAAEVMDDAATKDPATARILRSYRQAQRALEAWSAVSLVPLAGSPA